MAPRKKKVETDDEAPTRPAVLPGFTAPKIVDDSAWLEKPKRLSPFDFLKAINETKINLIAENSAVERDYTPFVVLRGLSLFSDTVKAANMLNERAGTVTNRQHFDFLLQTVAPRKRFSPWFKAEPDAQVDLVAAYYGCSKMKARQIVSLHTKAQLQHMHERLSTGGHVK